ncbi:MAG: BMP family ABC transporter substrate-binding protein [Spirochaetes bacterium]|nr:BMP family ABC transporter substrate-binding protein [Spirochaetota bacterium]MBP8991261.1 BMP family ABC transporter substrate-binding protein [Spirochaetota bacterium]HOV46038.1 BMP family ABC transporter substrate-binding protein [Exilispira sp.]HQM88659.1 BMP family ABC transporter substrate-binding protein [Exilispira sp.]HQQ20202.1 BMP family ABC transporter substrate-binding protein [Exilispira sp.]
MSKKKLVILALISLVLILCFSFISCANKEESDKTSAIQGRKIKAGFIYVGPIGDFGWSNAHEVGRLYVEKKFPWLESVYIENVPEGDVERYIDRLINEEKCEIVFTTSFGFMDGTYSAAKKYPDKTFMHCSGYKRDSNLGTYFAELYQAYYLNGLMAGALTKTNKIGYVGAHPTPEVVRHINAFALGIKEVNPEAKVYVRWLYSWYDPAKAKEAAESLISEGIDTLAFTEDSTAVVDVGEEHTKNGKQIYVFSHYSPMQKFGPDAVVSGQLVDWGIMYEEILRRYYTGTWDNRDLWWLMKEGACKIGGEYDTPINSKFVDALKAKTTNDPVLGKISIYDLVFKRIAQMSEPTVLFDPFTGPIKDNKGILKLPPNVRASYDVLWSVDWFVSNVVGSVPKQ